MKIGFIFLALLSLGAAANASPGKLPFISSSTSSEVYKMSVIDLQLKEAKTFGDIKKVVLLMNEFVMPVGDSCRPPTINNFKVLCADVASRAKAPQFQDEIEYNYEYEILRLACVNIGNDSEAITNQKVQKWWNKYKTSCTCDAIGFGLQNGSFLKFALAKNMPDVIETLASIYGCDINFIDPADGLNLLDYLVAEIARLKEQDNSESAVLVYEKYKLSVIGLGGKSSK
jgi:hypothetical protein